MARKKKEAPREAATTQMREKSEGGVGQWHGNFCVGRGPIPHFFQNFRKPSYKTQYIFVKALYPSRISYIIQPQAKYLYISDQLIKGDLSWQQLMMDKQQEL